jgi:hypothetical protein
MDELINSIVGHREIAIFVIGLLLLIGAITKGEISVGSIEIPAIGTGQAKLLGGLGFSLILLAFFLFINPKADKVNNRPEALDDFKSIEKGEEITIAVLENDTDKDSTDKLKVSVVESTDPGGTSLEGSKIKYIASQVGKVKITYQVSDGAGGKDTAEVKITVKNPPPKLVNKKGKLINIYGQPKIGEYPIDLENKIKMTPVKLITANDVGEFDLRTKEENKRCKIFFEAADPTNFYLDYQGERKTVEYNPLDSIAITFCRGYQKTETIREPIGPFRDRFNILFDELTKDSVETFQYGILHLGVKFFGSNKIEERGKLDFNFIQKNRDKIIYDPVKITSGSRAAKTYGWNSNLKKRLLTGEYELEIKSQNGTLLRVVEFEIK